MKICDVTQFYSPLSGGVKRYLHEKIDYIDKRAPRDEHVLIVPGARTKLKANGRSRVYTIRSPLVSHTARDEAFPRVRSQTLQSTCRHGRCIRPAGSRPA